MTRPPVPGRCKTRLIPALGPEGAALLHEAMLRDVAAALSRLPARSRTLLVTPENDGVAQMAALFPVGWSVAAQEGEDLGARLLSALARFGREGSTVFFGSDAPTLRYDALGPLLEALRPDGAFIAPCADGGYTAIGLGGHQATLLQGIPWSTQAVCAATRARAKQAGIALEERPLGDDVDEPADLERLIRELADEPRRAPVTAALLRSLKKL